MYKYFLKWRKVVMSPEKTTILESWPALKDDLGSFLSDTDAWVISELKKFYTTKDWNAVSKLIEVMEFVHNMHHSH